MPLPNRIGRRNVRGDIDPLMSYFGGGGYGSAPPSEDIYVLRDGTKPLTAEWAPGQIVTYCQWPDSKHNSIPSLAVDLAPYPIDWSDLYRFHELAGRMLQVAALFDIDMTWGGHWSKPDMPHFQVRIRPI